MTTVTKQEQTQVEKANVSGKRPVVFVHGLWLLPTAALAVPIQQPEDVPTHLGWPLRRKGGSALPVV
jgi:non-heme chloroperoxidase